jgi:lysozyme
MNKKKLVRIIMVVVIFLLVVFIFYTLKELNKDDHIKLKDNLTVEVGYQKKVSNFVKSLDGKLIDSKIDISKIGTKKVIFYYTVGLFNYKKSSSFKLKIVDTKAPVAFMQEAYTVYKGTDFGLDDVICVDNYDAKPTCKIIGNFDANKIGTYNLVYEVSDKSGNKQDYNFKLRVIKKPTTSSNNNSSSTTTSTTKFSDVLKKYNKDEVGIDVSKWQEKIDFKKVKKAGAKFVIIRIGYQYQNKLIKDPYFETNYKEARAAGLKIGGYFYSKAVNTTQALEQAKFVLKNIKGKTFSLPIAYDFEAFSNFNNLHISLNTLNNAAFTFIDYLEENNYKGMLYGSKYYLEKMWDTSRDTIWLAHYTSNLAKSSYSGKYYLWQLCNDGKIDGINSDVDIDILFK